jgi:predicted transcriptional regulator
MDLSFLIPSKIRRAVLAYFVNNPDAEVYIRELARELEQSPQLVYRELINLENWGLLFSRKQGKQRAFRVNQKFPFFPPIQDLVKRYEEEQARRYDVIKTYDLTRQIKRLKKIPVPDEIKKGLQAKRKKPRSYTEEKILSKHVDT